MQKTKRGFFAGPQTLDTGWLAYALVALLVLAAWLVFSPALRRIEVVDLRQETAALLAVLGILALVLRRVKLLNWHTAACLVLCGALFVHLCYCLYTSPYNRQHDVHGLADTGHMGYILHFYNTLRLPDHYNYQFYQGPLHHIIAGLALRAEAALGHPPEEGVQVLRFLPLLYTGWGMVVCHRLLRALPLSRAARFLAFVLVAGHPTFTLVSGSINNDALCFLLTMAALYRALRWYRRPTFANIALTGVLLALGALAKSSALLLAVPIGFLFLARLWRGMAARRLEGAPTAKTLWAQYGLFAVVAVPLGLSHSLRNFFVLDQPLGYTPSPGGDPYGPDITFADRFLKPFSPNLFSNVYCDFMADYNAPEYLLRSSLFGEYIFAGVDWLARLLTVLAALVVLVGIAAAVWKLAAVFRGGRAGGGSAISWLCIGIYIVALLGSYLVFNLNFPYACTMDFRYLLPLVPLGGAFIGAGYDLAARRGGTFARVARPALWGLAGAFAAGSSAFYLLVQ